MGENPLFLIWYRTREVIEKKLEDTSKEQIILLIAVFGIALMLNNAAARGLGDHYSMGTILLYSILFGPLMGALAWVILSGLLHWISRLLGGTGTWKETRTAVAGQSWFTAPCWCFGFLNFFFSVKNCSLRKPRELTATCYC